MAGNVGERHDLEEGPAFFQIEIESYQFSKEQLDCELPQARIVSGTSDFAIGSQVCEI